MQKCSLCFSAPSKKLLFFLCVVVPNSTSVSQKNKRLSAPCLPLSQAGQVSRWSAHSLHKTLTSRWTRSAGFPTSDRTTKNTTKRTKQWLISRPKQEKDFTWLPAVCLSAALLCCCSLPPSPTLPLCSNKHSILTAVELCRCPRVCMARQSSGCLGPVRNNKGGHFSERINHKPPFTCLKKILPNCRHRIDGQWRGGSLFLKENSCLLPIHWRRCAIRTSVAQQRPQVQTAHSILNNDSVSCYYPKWKLASWLNLAYLQ